MSDPLALFDEWARYSYVQSEEPTQSLTKKPEKLEVKCEICDKKMLKTSLKAHIKLHEIKLKGKIFKCNKCLKSFYTSKSLQKHITGHLKPFVCFFCGKRYCRKQSLVYHLKTKLN